MNKSKENKLIYMHMYIYTHPREFEHIYKYRYTYSHKESICYSGQIVLLKLCLKMFKRFALLIESGKLFQIEGPI